MSQNWAIHPYLDVKRFNLAPPEAEQTYPDIARSNTRALWNLIPAGSDVWFTEIGSRVDSCCRKDPQRSALDEPRNTLASQAAEVNYLLTTLARDSGGVERLYYYHWLEPKAATDNRVWDSGLLSPDGEPRPVYNEFANRP